MAETNFDDEIDLRAIALTIWKGRVLIVVAVVVFSLLGFAVSNWVLPRKYQANAYLLISKTVGLPGAVLASDSTQNNAANPISSTQDSMPALADLVTAASSPKILGQVLQDPAVVAGMGQDNLTLADLTGMLVATAVGSDQISLQVNDTRPERASLLANTWAQIVADKLNTTYGSAALFKTLDTQFNQSQQAYQLAQTALEEAISKSPVDALNAQRNRKRADLDGTLASISRNTRVLNDLQIFEKGLSGLAPNAPISLGDGLVLSALYQHALTEINQQFSSSDKLSQTGSAVQSGSIVLQIDGAAFANMAVSEALKNATRLRAALQTQLIQLQSEQSLQEQEIPQLQHKLENAKSQIAQLSALRDLTLQRYTELLQQKSDPFSVSQVSVDSPASVPTQSVSPSVLKNSALAGMAGLILAILWVLLQNWWQTNTGKL